MSGMGMAAKAWQLLVTNVSSFDRSTQFLGDLLA